MISVADFGNSRLKILINNEIFRFAYADLNFQDFLELLLKHKIEKLIYSSVNKISIQFVEFLDENSKIMIIKAENIIENQNILDFSKVISMGLDRKIGLVAASLKYSLPLITVDCGTAITINICDEYKQVLGGMIYPGLQTQAKALFANTSNLPEINLKDIAYKIEHQNLIWGNDTQTAIASAILKISISGIYSTLLDIKNYFSDFSSHISVIVTGGDADIIFESLSKIHSNSKNKITLFKDENLILEGLKQLSR